MRKAIFIVLLLCAASTPAISEDDNLEIRTYYQNSNTLKALLSSQEIERLKNIKKDLPIEQKLKKAGISSDKRIREIQPLVSYLLAHKKKDVNKDQDDDSFGISLGRLSSFEMLKGIDSTRNGEKARIALYSDAGGRSIDDIRSSIIKGFENGQMSKEDILKMIDFREKGIMGLYEDKWIKENGRWYIVVSSLLLLK
jgi:hypothetical protein